MPLAGDRETPQSFRQIFVGQEKQDIQTTGGKQVIRAGASKENADVDIRDYDLFEDAFETETLNIGGTSGISIAIGSNSNEPFSVEIDLMDDGGAVRETVTSDDYAGLAGDRVLTVVPVFGDRIVIRVLNESGTGNVISGSININTGLAESVTATLNAESITVTGESGDAIADLALSETPLGGDDALLTYASRALNSQGVDEFVARVTDSAGSQIDPLTDAVTSSVGGDEVRVSSPNPLDVSASEVDVDITAQTAAPITVDDGGDFVSGVEDATGSQINPDQSPEYPDNRTVGHNLDPDVDSDLVLGPLSVARSEAILLSGDSQDDQNWSVTLDWQNSNGDVFQTQTAADLSLSGVDNENARVIRKGPMVEVTVSSDAAAGTANTINFYVDVHR